MSDSAGLKRLSQTPSLEVRDDGVALRGKWVLAELAPVSAALHSLKSGVTSPIDCSRLEAIDTSGAICLIESLRAGRSPDIEIQFANCKPEHERILNLVNDRSKPSSEGSKKDANRSLTASAVKFVTGLGSATTSHFSFFGEALSGCVKMVLHPHYFRMSDLVIQIERAGVCAIPIVSLVTFLIGLVVAYLFANQAEKFGASIFVVDAIGMGMCRELAPVLTAIIVAGRSGSAFAAQIGSMKISDEVDAIRVLGLSPMHVLVLPRVLALVLALPFLVFIGDVFGILGGFVIAETYLQIPAATFFDRLQSVLALRHVWVGLGKAPLFAIIIALIGCRQGLTVEDNARSVGLHTTATVVQSIVAVIVLNALLAVLFQELGW